MSTTPAKKTQYRIRNWRAYNESLVQRGSLTVWVTDDIVAQWNYQGPPQRGAQFVYSDTAIECALTLRELFKLPLRATEGFMRSVLALVAPDLQVPDYSTFSKRAKTLKIQLPRLTRDEAAEGIHLVIDTSGLKIYGEGEWKVRQHGKSYRRGWRKLHLAIDTASQMIEAALLTEATVADADAVAPLLAQIPTPLEAVGGDGAYDKRKVYTAVADHSPTARCLIPPRCDAKIQQHGNCAQPPLQRDEHLRRIRKVGRAKWKKECGYHQRSLAETAMFRFKTLFGPALSNRTLETQATQVGLRCRALNIMTQLGMPDSYPLT
jgi:hypothetical protein